MKVSVKVQFQHISSSLPVRHEMLLLLLPAWHRRQESGPLREQWMKFVKKTQYEIEKSERRFPQPVGAVQWHHVNDHSSSHTMLKFHIWRRARRISWLAERARGRMKERERYNISTTMLSVMIPLHYLITAPKIIWLFCAVYLSAHADECELLCGLFFHECGVALFLFIYGSHDSIEWTESWGKELLAACGRDTELLLFYWPAPAHLHSQSKSYVLILVYCNINAFNFCENMNSNGVIYHQVSSGV